MTLFQRRTWVAFALGLAALPGCEQAADQAKKVAKKATAVVQQSTQAAADKVQAVTGTGGTADLDVGGSPAKASNCFSRLVLIPGRGRVFQISSYRPEGFDEKGETFPSFSVRAVVDVDDPNQLAGKSYKADVYLQSARGGAVLCSPPGQPFDLAITTVSGNVVEAQLSGTLASSDNGPATAFKGVLKGQLP